MQTNCIVEPEKIAYTNLQPGSTTTTYGCDNLSFTSNSKQTPILHV